MFENAKGVVSSSPGEQCLVFIGDNTFIQRNKKQGLEVLDRRIEKLRANSSQIEQNKFLLSKKLSAINNLIGLKEGIIELPEPINESSGHSINLLSSEKDMADFVKLVNSLDLSDDDQGGQLSEKIVPYDRRNTNLKQIKSILKNKNEISPINEGALNAMNALEKKGAIIPSSKEVLKDVVIEKNIFEDVSESVAYIKE